MPCRLYDDKTCATAGAQKKILFVVEPCANTSVTNWSKKPGVKTPELLELASRLIDCTNSSAPPAVPCGSCEAGVVTVAANERIPKKPIASHFFLCSRALRTASFAGSRPPYSSIEVAVPVNVQGVRVIWV